MYYKQVQICECGDVCCPCVGQCDSPSEVVLYRIDMDDSQGTHFCGECAADALDSGVFDVACLPEELAN